MNKNKDYYEILRIEKDSSEEEIRIAYRRLAKLYHPDLNQGDPNAKEKFIELKEAYDTLKDPLKRKIYDQAGYNPRNIDLSDLFGKYDFMRIKEILREIYARNSRASYYKPPPNTMYV